MTKNLIFIILFSINTLTIWSQVKINGIVTSKEDKQPIPGVTVIEKGTQNGTITKKDGTFSLTVGTLNSTLIFSDVGLVSQEYPLKGQSQAYIQMKMDCNIDFFDYDRIGFYLSSGVVNSPIGGQFVFSFPPFYKLTSLRSEVSYQTNFNHNEVFNASLDFNHLFASCNFDMDLKGHFRKVLFDQIYTSEVYSIESVLDFRSIYKNTNLTFIIGLSKLDYNKRDLTNDESIGPLVGLGKFIGRPLYLQLFGKASIYKNEIEYQAEVSRQFKSIYTFCSFYKLDTFSELTVGLGFEFTYKFRRHKKNAA